MSIRHKSAAYRWMWYLARNNDGAEKHPVVRTLRGWHGCPTLLPIRDGRGLP